MKKDKLKLATKILAIVIICLISFVGVFVQNTNRMVNVVKDFTLSKDLKGYRQILLKVSDAEGDNKSEDLTTENYEKAKSIIEKRLSAFGVEDFNISLDKKTGTIYLQIPEDDRTDKVVSNITQTGSIEIKDSEDANNILISSDKFKTAKTLYNTGDSGTTVYLELQFNKEGTEQLKNISENDYKTLPKEESNTTAENNTTTENTESKENVTTQNTTSDNTESSENKKDTQKKIALYMSGEQITTTSFDEAIVDGKIDLRLGQTSTDSSTISDNLSSGSTIVATLNNGILPLKYEVDENEFVKTDISTDTIRNVLIAVAIVIGILLIYMVIKYKSRGLLAAVSYIGFIALYALLLRYTNVTIALEGIVASVIIAILNYFFTMKLLNIKTDESNKYYKEYAKMLMNLLPIFAISIIFCFMKVTVLTSLGMVAFWGISLIAIYNITATKNILD